MPSAPSNEFQLIALLAFVLPGIIYEAVLAKFRGPSPQHRDATSRILSALCVSTMLTFVYLALLGELTFAYLNGAMSGDLNGQEWLRASAAGLFGLFIVPSAAAFVTHAVGAKRRNERVFSIYDPTPSAWDFVFSRTEPSYLRIMLKDGSFVGGWYGENSFAAGYPDVHEVYIEDASAMSADGKLGEPTGQGVWVAGDQVATIEFLTPQ